jgi:hypothetical protein
MTTGNDNLVAAALALLRPWNPGSRRGLRGP